MTHLSQDDARHIGPFPWWRWAVVPAHRHDITGIGYWTKAAALRFWHEAHDEFPNQPPPLLLKRTGWRSYREENSVVT